VNNNFKLQLKVFTTTFMHSLIVFEKYYIHFQNQKEAFVIGFNIGCFSNNILTQVSAFLIVLNTRETLLNNIFERFLFQKILYQKFPSLMFFIFFYFEKRQKSKFILAKKLPN